EALRAAAGHPGGATVYFPPGEYYLGAVAAAPFAGITGARNVRLIGERATISCRTLGGISSMITFAGCRNIAVENIAFRDHGLDRDNVSGAIALSLTDDGNNGSEDIEVRDCRFESVLTAVRCRTFDDARQARVRGIVLSGITVSRSC